MTDQDQPAAGPQPRLGYPRGLRLSEAQDRALRSWPRERIRPKSVALGVMSLLAELDATRQELETARAERDKLRLGEGEIFVFTNAEFCRFVQEAREQRGRAEQAEAKLDAARAEAQALREALLNSREWSPDEVPDGVACWCLVPKVEHQQGCTEIRALVYPPARQPEGDGADVT
jgi:hypothetical protein